MIGVATLEVKTRHAFGCLDVASLSVATFGDTIIGLAIFGFATLVVELLIIVSFGVAIRAVLCRLRDLRLPGGRRPETCLMSVTIVFAGLFFG
jgi:hypothetical protein